MIGTSLVVQWLRLGAASTAGDEGSIPGGGAQNQHAICRASAGAVEVLVTFYSLIWVLATWVQSFGNSSSSCTLMICALSYMYVCNTVLVFLWLMSLLWIILLWKVGNHWSWMSDTGVTGRYLSHDFYAFSMIKFLGWPKSLGFSIRYYRKYICVQMFVHMCIHMYLCILYMYVYLFVSIWVTPWLPVSSKVNKIL